MDQLKRQAAARALEQVRDGMQLGLGTGSTAKHFVELLGERVRAGLNVIGVPTSEVTRADAERCGISLTTLDDIDHLDLTVDGADEVDPALDLIKGGGGALLREKIVAQATKRQIIVVDDSKLSPRLGTHWALPIEVIEFGWKSQARFLQDLGATVAPRVSGSGLFRTDSGNMILDCNFGPISDSHALAAKLAARTGIV